MLKPKAVALRIMLWKFYNNIGENSEIPKSGLNFLTDLKTNLIKNFYYYADLKIWKLLYKS